VHKSFNNVSRLLWNEREASVPFLSLSDQGPLKGENLQLIHCYKQRCCALKQEASRIIIFWQHLSIEM
jgi:hypothetical protein